MGHRSVWKRRLLSWMVGGLLGIAGLPVGAVPLWQVLPPLERSEAAVSGGAEAAGRPAPPAEASLPDFRGVLDSAQSAVAALSTLERTSGSNPLHGVVPAPVDSERQKGLGSGFFIHPAGYLVTNAHVVEGVLGIRASVPHAEGWREFPARVLGIDRATDVALLKVDAKDFEFPVLPLGDSETLSVAEWVAAIGNPFGLRHSVTLGIISFKGRGDVRPAGRDGYYDYLQTDAAINPGNSGGPLLNQRGEVVGIANAVNAVGQGIGFAIPINLAKSVLYELMARGDVTRSWLGIRVDELTPARARTLGLRETDRGVLVAEVMPGAPGERSGLQKDDLIVSFDGQPVHDAQELRFRTSMGTPGSKVKVLYRRAGQSGAVSLELQALPAEQEKAWTGAEALTGLTVRGVGVLKARQEGLAVPLGVEVVTVKKGSRGEACGLRPGDVVLKAEQTLLVEPQNLSAVFEKLAKEERVRLVVRRDGETRFFWLGGR